MGSKKEEALIAKQDAEKRFAERDFVGAKSFAIKAQMLCPELEDISQMVATYDIYVASEAKVNGEVDFYSVLGLKSSCDRSVVKKRYKKLAAFLHPDKNRTVGADEALRLVSDAWAHLSDNAKRNGQISSTMVSCGKSYVPPTFWTVCNSCKVRYEYLRKYVDKRLSCKNCRSTFIAVKLRTPPISGSYHASHWSVSPSDGYGHSQGYNNGVSHYPTNAVYVSDNGVSGYSSEYVSDVSFQWSTNLEAQTGYASTNGYSTSMDTSHQTNGYLTKPVSFGTKATRPYKRRKVDDGGTIGNGAVMGSNAVKEAAILTENGSDGSLNRRAIPAAVDVRQLLINKARKEICKRLKEIKLASSQKGENLQSESGELEPRKKVNTDIMWNLRGLDHSL